VPARKGGKDGYLESSRGELGATITGGIISNAERGGPKSADLGVSGGEDPFLDERIVSRRGLARALLCQTAGNPKVGHESNSACYMHHGGERFSRSSR